MRQFSLIFALILITLVCLGQTAEHEQLHYHNHVHSHSRHNADAGNGQGAGVILEQRALLEQEEESQQPLETFLHQQMAEAFESGEAERRQRQNKSRSRYNPSGCYKPRPAHKRLQKKYQFLRNFNCKL